MVTKHFSITVPQCANAVLTSLLNDTASILSVVELVIIMEVRNNDIRSELIVRITMRDRNTDGSTQL